MRRLLEIVALVSLLASPLIAQTPPKPAHTVKMEATSDLILREAPPSGILNVSGNAVGTVKKGETVVAKEEKTIKNLFGEYKYYKVDVIDVGTGKPKQSGWVYAGQADKVVNLKSVTVAPVAPVSK